MRPLPRYISWYIPQKSDECVEKDMRLGLGIGLSIFFYALAVNIAWRYRSWRPGWLKTIESQPYAAVVRFLYYVGMPYLALLLGATSPQPMGLVDLDWLWASLSKTSPPRALSALVLDWLRAAGLGVALGLGLFLLLALTWWYYARSLKTLPGSPPHTALTTSPPTEAWWSLLLDAIYLEVHWAFYRSVPIIFLKDYYLGSFLGLLLVGLEWWTDPRFRTGLNSSDNSSKRVGDILTAGLALGMTIIFFFIRNFWLMVPLHWAIEMGCRHLAKTLFSFTVDEHR